MVHPEQAATPCQRGRAARSQIRDHLSLDLAPADEATFLDATLRYLISDTSIFRGQGEDD